MIEISAEFNKTLKFNRKSLQNGYPGSSLLPGYPISKRVPGYPGSFAIPIDDIDNKVTIFENIHRDIINKHAPFHTFQASKIEIGLFQ